MNTLEIKSCFTNVKRFGGVIARDDLLLLSENEISNHNKFFIVNTDPRNKPGKHWICIYVDKESCEFFDSLGRHPSYYHNTFVYFLINNGPRFSYNSKRIQNFGSNLCGEYCVQFAILRSNGYSMNDILARFSNNFEMNDVLAVNFYKQLVRRIQFPGKA
jgi:hypothetical protein